MLRSAIVDPWFGPADAGQREIAAATGRSVSAVVAEAVAEWLAPVPTRRIAGFNDGEVVGEGHQPDLRPALFDQLRAGDLRRH